MLITQCSSLGGTAQLSEQLGQMNGIWNREQQQCRRSPRHSSTSHANGSAPLGNDVRAINWTPLTIPQLLRTSARDVLSACVQLPRRHLTAIEGGPSTATPRMYLDPSRGIVRCTAVPISVRATSNSRLRYYRPLRYDSIEELLVADRRSETWRRDS